MAHHEPEHHEVHKHPKEDEHHHEHTCGCTKLSDNLTKIADELKGIKEVLLQINSRK